MADKIKKAKALRQIEMVRLDDLFNAAQAAVDDVSTRSFFEARIADIEEIKFEFNKQHGTLINLIINDDEEFEAALETLRTFDTTFYKIKAYYNDMFSNKMVNKQEAQDASLGRSQVNLPKFDLVKFKGDIKCFPTYLDMFNSAVHENNLLNPIDKFRYLISSLEGPPLKIVNCLPMTTANYIIAYNSLVKRYKNKRLLSQAYWSAIENSHKLTSEDPHLLRALLDIFYENLEALKALDYPVDSWDFVLAHMLLNKIDDATAKRFELFNDSEDNMPTFKTIYNFLEKQCSSFSALQLSQNKSKLRMKPDSSKNIGTSSTRPTYNASYLGTTKNPYKNCSLCNSLHPLYKCPDFHKKSPDERFQFVKTKTLCVNCLSSIHKTFNCNSSTLCRICKKKHHTMLHFETATSNSDVNSANNAQTDLADNNHAQTDIVLPSTSGMSSLAGVTASPRCFTTVLLSTALVEVLDVRGNYQKIRVLLDSGSQTSFISLKCANRLGLPKQRMYSEIQGIGETGMNTQLGSVVLSLRPIGKDNFNLPVNAVILPRICSNQPTSPLLISSWNHIQNLNLADPDFDKPGPVDVLLGADLFPYIIQGGRVCGYDNEPVALNTIFGFILMGNVKNNYVNSNFQSFLCQVELRSLNNIMSKFWEMENIPTKPHISPEDDLCETKYLNSVYRNPEGRYVVALPFKDDEPSFSNSRNLALKRFISLEQRLLKDPALYTEYSNFLKEYLNLNHMKLILNPILTEKSFYIPHHCVLKPDSLSTKLRVVFNASAKINNNISLNDTLLVGPKLQKDIVQILLNFRLHNIVLHADIKKMYRQILITADHQDYQRILWRFDSSGPILEFKLCTVTYGVSSAPYLALRTLLRLAEDEKRNFPHAAKVLTDDTYVDDIVTGCATIDEAISLQRELTQLLQKGGFELHKWTSNKPQALSHLSPLLVNPAARSLDSDETTKVLGLLWLPSSDVFTYNVTPMDRPCTKRHILSELARVFDPIGFLTPITFFIKYLMQKLWVLGLDWDDQPPSEILRIWTRYKNELKLLSKFNISRHIDINFTDSLELHGFSDASERGFGASVYLRTCHHEKYSIYFICAKSRVAPLRTISIPRLELCAAVLLSELLEFVITTYKNKIEFNKIYAWTDSTVCLSWIKSHPYKWKTFVSNRISIIQQRIDPGNWYHIKSDQNPADLASRGTFPSELLNNKLWWSAPDFLKLSRNLWPISKVNSNAHTEISSEERKNTSLNVTKPPEHFLDLLLSNHSSLNSLKRILAHILRFINNCRFPHRKISGNFSYTELHNSLLVFVKRAQHLFFSEEINKIKSKKRLPKPFQKLNVFLDDHDMLRVGGRLHHSTFAYDKKHPFLLPRTSKITYLIIEQIHLKYFHAGVQTVQFLVCQNFWILSAKRAVRHVLSRCVRCFKTQPKSYQPVMGNLPSPRISQVKAFSNSGVDFAGPLTVTLGKTRGAKTYKAWICLFICLSTKSVHIELCSDLTAEAFLAALRRFISRRGRVSHLYSDNATNFIKANKELINLTKLAASQECIEWHFIPPAAPHFGGIWEAGIKSMKGHLIRVIGKQILTYEELNTVLCQIEAILNSRPITPLSLDPNDFNALTPGHFLTLEPLTAAPDEDLISRSINRLTRWQLLQRIQQDIWRRWQRDYLCILQNRGKWLEPTSSPDLGTLVIIKDDTTHPLQWRLGRITALYPGSDGVARVADVATSNGSLRRPLTKLCPLPVSNVSAFENA